MSFVGYCLFPGTAKNAPRARRPNSNGPENNSRSRTTTSAALNVFFSIAHHWIRSVCSCKKCRIASNPFLSNEGGPLRKGCGNRTRAHPSRPRTPPASSLLVGPHCRCVGRHRVSHDASTVSARATVKGLGAVGWYSHLSRPRTPLC